MENLYKNEGMAIFIKGKMVLGIHPDNLINNLSLLSKGNMFLGWDVLAKNAGIDLGKLPENAISGAVNFKNNIY